MKVNPFKTTLYSSVLLAGLAATSVAAADEAKDVTTTTDTDAPYQIRLQNQVLTLLKQQVMQQLLLQYLEQKKKLLLKQILL